MLTKAAEPLPQMFLPKVDASAAAAGNCYCAVRTPKREGGYIYEHFYWKTTHCYGNCAIWGVYCSKRRTPERC
jgi:hypothetical protein